MEKHKRTVAKAASYRIIATTMVFLIAFLYTNEPMDSVKIGGTAAVGKTALYYTWERIWNKTNWGMHEE